MNELDMMEAQDVVNETVDIDELSPEIQDEVNNELANTNDVKVLQLDGRTVKAVTVAGVTVVIAAWEGGKWVYKKAVKPLAKKVVNWFKTNFRKKEAGIVVAETTTPSGESTVQAATPVEEQQ